VAGPCYNPYSAPGRDVRARRGERLLDRGDPCFVNGRPAVFVEQLDDETCSVRFPYKDGSLSEPRVVSMRKVSRDLTESITQSRSYSLG
jgi:hypothetical protein